VYLFTWLLELIKFIKNGCAKIYRGTEAVYTNEGLNKALLNTYSVVRIWEPRKAGSEEYYSSIFVLYFLVGMSYLEHAVD